MRGFARAAVLLTAFAGAAAAQPGTPVKTGRASFSVGTAAITYDSVSGNINVTSGFIMAMVTFANPAKPHGDHLTISVLMKGPGAVDLNQSVGNGIGYWNGWTIYQYEKGKSQCTMAVTTLIATAIEGTANCPVMNEMNGPGTLALTKVTFSATTK